MKRSILVVVVIASMMTAVSCAKGTEETKASPVVSAAPASENVEQVITQKEREWVAAILQKDTAAIDRLIADDFSGTTNDQSYSKEEAIADVKSGTHESLDLDNIEVRVFGDAAVATMGQNEKSQHGKEDFSGRYLFTNVWVKRNGQWQAVASHGSRIR
jgi:ketosteroid isomerase-like protein